MTSKDHPYLAGNFAPVREEYPLSPCSIEGSIPFEFAGGEYVRNGANPQPHHHTPQSQSDYHWFDGDGLLHSVYFSTASASRSTFSSSPPQPTITPLYSNKYLLTDVHLTSRTLTSPLLPSISSLQLPHSLFSTLFGILRAVFLCFLRGVARLSVANTNVIFHDGRALALCESGKAWEFRLPGLESVGWWAFEGSLEDRNDPSKGLGSNSSRLGKLFHEWMTAHPRTDPVTGELILFGSTFYPPFVTHSVIGPQGQPNCLSVPIPGISSPKMMHDFGVTQTHSIILDLPLSLSPWNLLSLQPVVKFDQSKPSRFGLVPRYFDGNNKKEVMWFEDEEACCIFHTANSWDSYDYQSLHSSSAQLDRPTAVNLLAARFTSARLVSLAGNIPIPASPTPDLCLLTYYRFPLPFSLPLTSPSSSTLPLRPSHRFALSSIPFEFAALPPSLSTMNARYIYGCSMSEGGFDARLGAGAKIDVLVKLDVRALVARGLTSPPEGAVQSPNGDGWIGGVVDGRDMGQIFKEKAMGVGEDWIKAFKFPDGVFGQEMSFVSKGGGKWRAEGVGAEGANGGEGREDEGWLCCFVFDEGKWLDGTTGSVKEGARSELWILDAALFGSPVSEVVVAKVILPARVPYGLHGRFFTPDQIASQRPNIPTLTTDISLPPAPALSDALYPVDTVLEAELKDFDLLDPPRESKATAAAKSASELIRSTLLGLGLVSPTTA